jgi:hypothetical protein
MKNAKAELKKQAEKIFKLFEFLAVSCRFSLCDFRSILIVSCDGGR